MPTQESSPWWGRASSTPLAIGPAAGAWFAAFTVVNLVVVPGLIVVSGAELGDVLTTPRFALAAFGSWLCYCVALVVVARRFGTGRVLADLGWSLRIRDLIGVPIGVAMQVAVVPLLYVPLRAIWPDTFSTDEIERRARELIDTAGQRWTWLLVVIVVIGAPIVEELVYRGMIQRSLGRALDPVSAWIFASVLFGFVHLSVVEFPGLLVAGLAFGIGAALTDRIGVGVWAHAGFNATALAMLLW